MKKFIAILLVAMMMVALFAGCAPKGADAIITINIGEEPLSIDPTLNNAVDGATYIVHLFEGLTTVDKNLTIVAGIAKSWDISADGITYTFHLRDAKWSDGVAVTAKDFVYSWRRAVDSATAADYAYQMFYIKNAAEINAGKSPLDTLGVKAIDDKTLEVTLVSPVGYFLSLAGFPTYFPIREDVVTKNAKWATEASTIVTNGPYILKSWEHNATMVMEKNPTYWDESKILPKELKFELMADENTILSAFKTGEILFADTLPSSEINAMTADGTLSIKPQLGTYYYDINNTKAPYNDVRVRKALSLAIDREFIINSIAKGNEIPAAAFVPSGVPDATAGSDFRKNGKTYFDPSAAAYEANVTEAKKLLSEAGFPGGKGFPKIDFVTNNTQGHIDIATAVAQMWKEKLGIDTTISSQEWAVFQQTRTDGKFDIARDGWLGDYVDPMTFLDMWTTNSGQNNSKFSNAAYDALIATAKTSTKIADRMTAMHKAEDIIIGDQMAVIPIYYYTDLFLTNKTLKGVVYSPLGFKYFMYATIQ